LRQNRLPILQCFCRQDTRLEGDFLKFNTKQLFIIAVLLAGFSAIAWPAVTKAGCPEYGVVRLALVDREYNAGFGVPRIIVPGENADISIDSSVFSKDTIIYQLTIQVPASDTTELHLNLDLCDSIMISAVAYDEGYRQGVIEAECEIAEERLTIYALHSRKLAPGYDTGTGLCITQLPRYTRIHAQGVKAGHNDRIIQFIAEHGSQAYSRYQWNRIIVRPMQSFFQLCQSNEPIQLPFKGKYIQSPDGKFSVRLDVSEVDSIVQISIFVMSSSGISYCSHQAFWDFSIEFIWGPTDADIAFLRWGKSPNVACKRGFASYATLDLRNGTLLAVVKGDWLAPVP